MNMPKIDIKNTTEDIESDYYTVKTKTKITKHYRYDIYISNQITKPCEYIELLHILKVATADDEIHIYINSGGGYCSSTTQITNAMKNCLAHIVCHAEGIVASCATWIFLAGDSFVIEEDIEFMCHYYSGGTYGKGNELEIGAKFSKKYWHNKFKKIYKGFLTDEESQQLIDGKDFYFNQKQLAKRLKGKYKGLDVKLDLTIQ